VTFLRNVLLMTLFVTSTFRAHIICVIASFHTPNIWHQIPTGNYNYIWYAYSLCK